MLEYDPFPKKPRYNKFDVISGQPGSLGEIEKDTTFRKC